MLYIYMGYSKINLVFGLQLNSSSICFCGIFGREDGTEELHIWTRKLFMEYNQADSQLVRLYICDVFHGIISLVLSL